MKSNLKIAIQQILLYKELLLKLVEEDPTLSGVLLHEDLKLLVDELKPGKNTRAEIVQIARPCGCRCNPDCVLTETDEYGNGRCRIKCADGDVYNTYVGEDCVWGE